MNADRISDHDQFGWNLGYIAGEQERVALAAMPTQPPRTEVTRVAPQEQRAGIENAQGYSATNGSAPSASSHPDPPRKGRPRRTQGVPEIVGPRRPKDAT
jgi:hypothetical protein